MNLSKAEHTSINLSRFPELFRRKSSTMVEKAWATRTRTRSRSRSLLKEAKRGSVLVGKLASARGRVCACSSCKPHRGWMSCATVRQVGGTHLLGQNRHGRCPVMRSSHATIGHPHPRNENAEMKILQSAALIISGEPHVLSSGVRLVALYRGVRSSLARSLTLFLVRSLTR